jgi:predicted site-specific integrase-resolvase
VSLTDVPEIQRPMRQQEAADWLGVDRATLSQWTGQDDDPVPAYRLGKKPVYTKAMLVRWSRGRPYATTKS